MTSQRFTLSHYLVFPDNFGNVFFTTTLLKTDLSNSVWLEKQFQFLFMVLLVCFSFFLQTLPIAFVVMTRKTTEAYKAAFTKLRELGLDVTEVITDWEDGERAGWREAYRGCGRALIVWGCIWHYMRVSINLKIDN